MKMFFGPLFLLFSILALVASLTLASCNFVKGLRTQLLSADSTFLAADRRPPEELYEIVWALCAQEVQKVDSGRTYQQPIEATVKAARSQWFEYLSRSRLLAPRLGCNDLMRAAASVVLMHAQEATGGNSAGYTIGPRQLDELYHEILATTPSGAPPPVHEHKHLAHFSAGPRQSARQMVVDFFFEVVRAREKLYSKDNASVVEFLEDPQRVPNDWYTEPYYYTYVQYFGGQGIRSSLPAPRLKAIADPGQSMDMSSDFIGDGTFESLSHMLPYLNSVGIRNLYLLPHYESEGGDGGYDVQDYRPADRLGGPKGFRRLMEESRRWGIRIATDAVFNHTSYRHQWFEAFQRGQSPFANFYLDVSAWEDLGEVKDGSQGTRRYQSEGKVFDRVMIFPAISRDHFFSFDRGAGKRKAYRHFYPFQVDLNFLEPRVLVEIWRIVGQELADGQLAKRADAAIHWIKPVGTAGDGEQAAQAAIQLFRQFVSLVNAKAAVFPEAVNWVGKAHELFGGGLPIGEMSGVGPMGPGHLALYAFQGQSTALREMLALRDASAWWDYWSQASRYGPPAGGAWLNLLSHHDEMMMGLSRPGSRQRLADVIQHNGGITYKSGYSAAIRLADLLAEAPRGPSDGQKTVDARRIAMAQAALFLLPGVPQLYYGDEVMWPSNKEQVEAAYQVQKSYFLRMKNDDSVAFDMPADADIRDPRELLRGNIFRDVFMRSLASASRGGGDEAGLVIRTIQQLTALRRDPLFKESFSSWDMMPLHTGGDGSVLGLIRMAKESGATNLAALLNLNGVAQDVWLSEVQLAEQLGLRANGKGSLSARILLRVGRDGAQWDLADPIVGASHEGHLRVLLEPYEVVIFSGGEK